MIGYKRYTKGIRIRICNIKVYNGLPRTMYEHNRNYITELYLLQSLIDKFLQILYTLRLLRLGTGLTRIKSAHERRTEDGDVRPARRPRPKPTRVIEAVGSLAPPHTMFHTGR
jgi:hypothetical protein